MTTLLVLGAAMRLDDLETLRDWVIADQRDLELQDFVTAEELNGDWQPQVERARKLLDGYSGRLGIHGPFWGLHLATHDPEVGAVVTKRMRQGLAVCEALGATQMVIHSPYSAWSYNNFDNVPGEAEQLIERVHAILDPVIAEAENAGVTMVLENIEDRDPDARLVLAETFDSPAVALSVDTGHAHYARISTAAPPVDYYLSRAGSLLHHVHLQDTDGYADRHWWIGHGSINWHSVFAALAPFGATPRLILELRDKAGIRPSAEWLLAKGLAR